MNPPKRSLFLLTRQRSLSIEPLTEDMIDALNDPEVAGYAPGVLSVICEWMDLYQTHTFGIQVSDVKSYQLDLSGPFLSFLEQLPVLVGWLRESRLPVFHLDINSQGFDLRIELQRVGDLIHYACIEDHWQTAKRVEGGWEFSADSLKLSCESIAREIAVVGITVSPKITGLSSFQDWCAKCGYDLPADFPNWKIKEKKGSG